ncbi:MAG TPA: hypothetical protein VJU87_07065 [Gemmatimonadaceae bacterium]|nr:hypothetical protein [Gemmatimonadaceae bacterium]
MRYSRIDSGVVALAIGTTMLAVSARTAPAQVPAGWSAYTDGSQDYTVRADVSRREGGQGYAGATIRANVVSPRGTAMLAQSVRADAYRGKRVRLSSFLKTIGVDEGAAALWMRIDGPHGVLASDFMESRPIMGTNDWALHDVVLDVPANAVGITFGFLLSGGGQAWMDDVAFDVVGSEVAVTGHAGGLYPEVRPVAGDAPPRERTQRSAYLRAPDQPVNMSLRSTGRTGL